MVYVIQLSVQRQVYEIFQAKTNRNRTRNMDNNYCEFYLLTVRGSALGIKI